MQTVVHLNENRFKNDIYCIFPKVVFALGILLRAPHHVRRQNR